MLIHLLHAAGLGLVTLALIHVIFPRHFQWSKELASLSLLNRQIMQVHTFFIALTVALMGLLCLTCAPDLIATRLGNRIAFGLAVFWGLRLATQLAWYSPQLWRGKKFETGIHILFLIIWTSLTTLFAVVASGRWAAS